MDRSMGRAVFFVATTFAGVVIGAWVAGMSYGGDTIAGAMAGGLLGLVLAAIGLRMSKPGPPPRAS